jgi:hypothetical protein
VNRICFDTEFERCHEARCLTMSCAVKLQVPQPYLPPTVGRDHESLTDITRTQRRQRGTPFTFLSGARRYDLHYSRHWADKRRKRGSEKCFHLCQGARLQPGPSGTGSLLLGPSEGVDAISRYAFLNLSELRLLLRRRPFDRNTARQWLFRGVLLLCPIVQ